MPQTHLPRPDAEPGNTWGRISISDTYWDLALGYELQNTSAKFYFTSLILFLGEK